MQAGEEIALRDSGQDTHAVQVSPFALWNARIIRNLIRAVFGVDVSRWSVSRYTHRNGFTPQSPDKREREQTPAQVRRRMEHTYPRIRMAAKASAQRYSAATRRA